MVEFEYQPWNKIVVHEVVKYPIEHFIERHSIGREGGIGQPLRWANGLVYEFGAVRPTDEVINEQLKGTIHWSHLHYGVLDKYRQELDAPRSVKIPLINMSYHHIFSAMANWIKENFEE